MMTGGTCIGPGSASLLPGRQCGDASSGGGVGGGAHSLGSGGSDASVQERSVAIVETLKEREATRCQPQQRIMLLTLDRPEEFDAVSRRHAGGRPA